MQDVISAIEDCIVKLERLADKPFIDPEAYSAWCSDVATVLRGVLEDLDG
jgi:hypothetical protein